MLKKIMNIQRGYLLLLLILLSGVCACKKSSEKPVQPVTIVGKWLSVKQTSSLFNNGVKVDSVQKTKFGKDDFVAFYSDGSGYYSEATSNGPSLSEFSYKVSGTILTQYYSVENNGVQATITTMTANSLSIHVVLRVLDPHDATVIDTEIDDYFYSR